MKNWYQGFFSLNQWIYKKIAIFQIQLTWVSVFNGDIDETKYTHVIKKKKEDNDNKNKLLIVKMLTWKIHPACWTIASRLGNVSLR